MAKTNRHSLIGYIVRLLSIAPLLCKVATQVIDLIEVEITSAKKQIVLLIIFCILFGALLASSWLCLLAILCAYLISLNLSLIVSLSVIFILNILMSVIIGLLILNVNKDRFFPKSRKLLIRIKQ